MTSRAGSRNGGMLIGRNELSMPKWVTEQSDRIGPKPPAPPVTPENNPHPTNQLNSSLKTKQPEPDYEIIEFSNQQYSNTPLRPSSANSGSKTPDNTLKCTLCGSGNPWVTCDECSQQLFCTSCDDMFHKHPKRKGHQRKTIDNSRPPLPPKVLPGQTGPSPPVAPPRRNKRGVMTPLMQRKAQGNAMPDPFPESTSPTPTSKNSTLQDRIGSLPRGLNLLNRPLPETPKTPSESSRSTTPKSVFDNIQRPPSVALEKIKNKANATLDRMQILQQRYRLQKEQMERERSGTVTDQNMLAFDQWSSISQSPSHFRSGSMSSGINSSHLDLVDDNNFNLFHQRQMALQHHQMAAQRANQLGQRGMSSSVFNLNQMNRKQPFTGNGWMNNPIQQVQSMAHINCGNCSQQQLQWNGYNQHPGQKTQDPWSNQLASQQHLNRSNMSLNVPVGYMMQPQLNNMYPPPAFMNQRNFMQPMYPQPCVGGLPVMNPGLMCMPPSTSRGASRAGSRLASPAMSRKSVTLRRKQRSSYVDDEATDDEDSDDDCRSITSRHRRMSSASQFQLDDDVESAQTKVHRNRFRNQRRDSIAKSVNNDWAPGRKVSSSNNNRSADSGFNSPLKPSRIYSDLDSEGSGTRALVQAKIEQKLKEESLKQKHSRSKRQSKSPPPQKTSCAVQTPAVKQTATKHDKIKNHSQELEKHVKKSSESEKGTKNEDKVSAKPLEILEKEDRATEEKKQSEFENNNESEIESESESSEDSDIVKNESLEVNDCQEDDLGPPPSTPDHEWECEFCTFVNEANIKICSICCKTPKTACKTVILSKQIKPPQHHKENVNVSEKSATINKSPFAPLKQAAAQNGVVNDNMSSQTMNNSSDNTNDRTNESLENKESVEDVWASLDENIHATAHEVTLRAQSKNLTSESKPARLESQESDLRQSQAKEIAIGSPPPQTISTQTYETLPLQKPQTPNESVAKLSSQTFFDDDIQHIKFPLTPQTKDLRSFEAEVLNNIHNISHVPSQYQKHHANRPIHFYNERQRYRSNNDLRMDDTLSVDLESLHSLGKRQPSISELMMLQKSSSQMHSPYGGSTYDLPYHEPSSIRPKDMERQKESDIYKHTTEELNAAIKYCGPDIHPLVWLRENWPKLIQTVQSLATKYGQERAENIIGTISQMEAREALRMHTGNIWQAVSECIEQRQRKYREVSSKGNFAREDIVTALTTHQGNVEMALLDLGRTQLKPYLMRIWGSPGGVENESGSQPLPTSTTSTTSQIIMEKDIHNFLRANASDCMQSSNTTDAYLLNNQTPSPYDRPDSFNSPFESINHMSDNASSYSTDTKSTANIPLQLDESILCNKSVLKDLETLIGNMEHNQQKQNENVLRSIHGIITNLNTKSENEYDPETMRILTKSPIINSKLKHFPNDSDLENDKNIRNFVWQHIQEIMPNLVQQVELELVEGNENGCKSHEDESKIETTTQVKQAVPIVPPPPIDQDEFLMEEVIKPNIRNASIREELPPQYVYTAEIETFKLAFDKALELEHEYEFEFEFITVGQLPRKIYKMFKALQAENSENEVESVKSNQIKEIILSSKADSQGDETKEIIQSGSILNLLKENSITEEYTQIQELKTVDKTSNPNAEDASNSPKESETFVENHDSSSLDESLPSSEQVLVRNDSKLPEENKSNKTSFLAIPEVVESMEGNSQNGQLTNEEIAKEAPFQEQDLAAGSIKESIPSEYSINLKTVPVSTSISSLGSDSSLESKTHNELFNQEIDSNETNILENISNIMESYAGSTVLSAESEEKFQSESRRISNERVQNVNKKLSKIPVRRTASNKSLINSPTPKSTITSDFNDDIKAKDLNLEAAMDDNMNLSLTNLENSNNSIGEDEYADKELHSVESINSMSQVTLELDENQSPSPTNEMIFFIQTEGSENRSSMASSRSSSSLHSIVSQTVSFKPSSEFVPSGDPSKQNLTELVKDTQRLIKQMRDEISMDDFESSTDDGAYSDEFSDDYDDDDEEDWEQDLGESEDGEEYDDITEDFTEENEADSIEEGSISKVQSPVTSQESQNHIIENIPTVLSHSTESSTHSLAFSNEPLKQDIPTDTNNNNDTKHDETTAVAETENNFSPLSDAQNLENSQSSFQFIESESHLSEPPVETILSHKSAESTVGTSLIDSPIEKVVSSTPVFNEFLLENIIPELPVETVLESIQSNEKDMQDHALNNNSESESNLVLLENEQNLDQYSSNSNTPLDDLTPKATGENIISENSAEEPVNTDDVNTIEQTNPIDIQPNANTNEDLPKNITSTFLYNSPDEPNSSKTNTIEKGKVDASSTSKSFKNTQTTGELKESVKTPTKRLVITSRIPKPKEALKEQQKKVTPKSKQTDLKNKLYTRSKSFSGPTTPIGIASVKTISQKFISPSTNLQVKATKMQPTVKRKSSIVEAINKFTKPSTNSEKPAASHLFKTRTQPRIPKKKYHETCFSDDDYESSSAEEEIEPLEVRNRKLSVPVFKAYPSIQEPEQINTEKLVKRFLNEELATTVAEAQIAATLVSMKFPQDVSLWASKQCSDLDHAIALLKQECELCSGTYALNQIVSMLKCTHKCCKQCAKTYFTLQITERNINDCSCPFCKLPALHNQTVHEDENLEYFSNLDIFLKNILEPEVHELFQRKLRDRTLLKDPNFKWCVQCSSGFFVRPKQKRLICPDCGSTTCAQCRKPWQKQHEGISCEQFFKWESANDPEVQAKSIQQHLEQNGIDCPKCKFKYSLARGGCMHFTCTQCKYEFCYGCAKPFMMGAKCNISPYCAKLGLHAHHPRNCLFYLRDKLPVQLQILLKNNNVPYEVDPNEILDIGDDMEPSSSKKKDLLCPIPIQKETPTGLVDTRCNGDVPEKHAGMCRNHYVEYLTAKVAKASIDPLPIFDLTDCIQELRRRGLALPERGPWDTDEIYKNMCAEVIKNNIPLGIN